MGNQPSSGAADGKNAVRGFMSRSTGLLGLSKPELDERCKPSGLYPSCQWEDKAVRRLIGDGKLAARLRGTENRTSASDRECPICFLQYREINVTKCCSAHVCTECYLQVRPQKIKSANCPFCNHNKFSIAVAEAMDAEAMLAREEGEQRVIEAKIRERAIQQAGGDSFGNSSDPAFSGGAPAAGSPSSSDPGTPTSGFGSSLAQNERVATLRARSSSMSDHENENISEEVLRSSIAMTPEERRMLEDELRSQTSHPLALRLEAEAEERRLRNEQEYYRNNPAPLLDYRGRPVSARRSTTGGRVASGQPRRNWNQIVEAFERGGNGEVNSLDDLVVLEAAMILSMEEEARRRGDDTGSARQGGDSELNAERHAEEGFPLVRSILSGRQQGSARGTAADGDQNLASRRRGRNPTMRASTGGLDTAALGAALDSVGLQMRGMSEEDQLAMAIAASLQDQQGASDDNDEADADAAMAQSDNDGQRSGMSSGGASRSGPSSESGGDEQSAASINNNAVADNGNDSDGSGPPEMNGEADETE